MKLSCCQSGINFNCSWFVRKFCKCLHLSVAQGYIQVVILSLITASLIGWPALTSFKTNFMAVTCPLSCCSLVLLPRGDLFDSREQLYRLCKVIRLFLACYLSFAQLHEVRKKLYQSNGNSFMGGFLTTLVMARISWMYTQTIKKENYNQMTLD